MNSIDHSAADAAMTVLCAAFPRRLDEDQIIVWREALSGLRADLLGLAVRRLIREEGKFPVPATVIGYYDVVRSEVNRTDEERRQLAEGSGSRYGQSQGLINRRGRALLKAVAERVNGADVASMLPGDDEPLPPDEAAEIDASAQILASIEYTSRRRFFEEVDTHRDAGHITSEPEIRAIRRKYGVEPPKVLTYFLTPQGIAAAPADAKSWETDTRYDPQ